MSYLDQQREARQSAWHAAKALLDHAASENRDLTAEEQESYDRMNADIDRRGDIIADLSRAEERSIAIDTAMASAPEVRRTVEVEPRRTDADIIRAMGRGEIRTHTFERRDQLNTGDTSLVPVEFLDRIQQLMLYTGPMLDGAYFTRLDTTNGRDIRVPVEATRAAGSAVAEAAQMARSQGTYSELTLRSWKYGSLVAVTRELIEDSGIDIVSFLGRSMGVALGTAVNSALTLGTGTVLPLGISAAATTAGVTGGTGVAGVPTFDNLIDLVHSVDTLYANSPSAGFLMSRATKGAVRKLKASTSGEYLYTPAATQGEVDRLLGYPILENPYVAATAVNAKSVLFGDLSSYFVRVQGGITLTRSDEIYFETDEVGFKATIAVDGALGQVTAVKHFAGGTA